MYTIIGADGHQYGPVSADQIRQWVTEGRAAGTTLALPEGGTEWKPLSALPEFAPVFIPTTPPVMPRYNQRSKLAAGLLGILLGGWGVHRFYLGYIGIGIAQILVTILTCGIGALWGFIEGILILAGNTITTDARGMPLQD